MTVTVTEAVSAVCSVYCRECRVLRADRLRFRLYDYDRTRAAMQSAVVATRSAIHCRRTAIPSSSRVYPVRTSDTPRTRSRPTATNRDGATTLRTSPLTCIPPLPHQPGRLRSLLAARGECMYM